MPLVIVNSIPRYEQNTTFSVSSSSKFKLIIWPDRSGHNILYPVFFYGFTKFGAMANFWQALEPAGENVRPIWRQHQQRHPAQKRRTNEHGRSENDEAKVRIRQKHRIANGPEEGAE